MAKASTSVLLTDLYIGVWWHGHVSLSPALSHQPLHLGPWAPWAPLAPLALSLGTILDKPKGWALIESSVSQEY